MSYYECRVGDTDPPVPFVCQNADGTAYNLTGKTVAFYWRLKNQTSWTSGAATITGAASGAAEYRFTSGQTDVAGTYECKVVVTSSGNSRTFPSNGYPEFYIRP